MKSLIIIVLVLTAIFISVSCTEKEPAPKGSPEYIAEIEQWHNKRIERLKDENGWLTLVGFIGLKKVKTVSVLLKKIIFSFLQQVHQLLENNS